VSSIYSRASGSIDTRSLKGSRAVVGARRRCEWSGGRAGVKNNGGALLSSHTISIVSLIKSGVIFGSTPDAVQTISLTIGQAGATVSGVKTLAIDSGVRIRCVTCGSRESTVAHTLSSRSTDSIG